MIQKVSIAVQDGQSQVKPVSILKKVKSNPVQQNTLKELVATEEKSEIQKTFTVMRNKINTTELETQLRDMVTELVKPIVTLAKKNLVHNALKNHKIHEI